MDTKDVVIALKEVESSIADVKVLGTLGAPLDEEPPNTVEDEVWDPDEMVFGEDGGLSEMYDSITDIVAVIVDEVFQLLPSPM